MTFSPEDNLSSVPPPAGDDFDAKWGTGGLSLEPIGQSADGEPGSIDTSGLELEPMADAPKSPLHGYTPEMQAEDAELYSVSDQNPPGSSLSIPNGYTPKEFMQLKRELYQYLHQGNPENVQSVAEQINIAFDLAKERGIDIDFSKLEDIISLKTPNFIAIPTLGGEAYIFPRNSDDVFISQVELGDQPGGMGFDVSSEKTRKLSQDEALEARKKYKPEEFAQLMTEAQEIYNRRSMSQEAEQREGVGIVPSSEMVNNQDTSLRVEEHRGPFYSNNLTIPSGLHQKINGAVAKSEIRISANSKLSVIGAMADSKIIIEPGGEFDHQGAKVRVDIVRL